MVDAPRLPEASPQTVAAPGGPKAPQKTIAAPAPLPRASLIPGLRPKAPAAVEPVVPRPPAPVVSGKPAPPGSQTVMAKKPTPLPVAAAQAPTAPTESASSVACRACSTPNPAGMNFCKMCGSTLRQGGQLAARAALPSPLAAVVGKPRTSTSSPSTSSPSTPVSPAKADAPQRSCPSCGGMTPSAFAFCQHCGSKVGVVDAAEVAIADTLTDDSSQAEPRPAAHGETDELIVPLVKKRSPDSQKTPPVVTDDFAPAYGRLVTVLRDGSDGEVYDLTDDLVDIGRTEGQLLFADDAFLAGRHVRLERRAAAVVLLPLDTTNGVYVRVRQGEVVRLRHGDQLLCGKEVLRFEVLEPEERAQLPAMQHGVRLFGSPMRAPWARLLQMVQAGVASDVYHLVPSEVILGREEGDLRFPDDEFMSRRHARIASRDGTFELVDEGSSNGTYIRLRGERVLEAGDRLRLGDQLFRYEPMP